MLKKLIKERSGDEDEQFKMPPIANLLKMIDGWQTVSNSEKEQLKEKIYTRYLKGNDDENIFGEKIMPEKKQRLTYESTDYEYYLFLLMLALLCFVFGK